MENKYVGYILVGIAVLLIVIIFLYDGALKEIVKNSCGTEHSITCPMNQTINEQTYLALAIVGLLILVAVVLIFSKPREKVIVHEKKILVKEKKKKLDVSGLEDKEKKLVRELQAENGTMFQADLMEKMEIGKVGMTRLLDKLEAKQIV